MDFHTLKYVFIKYVEVK